MSTIEPFNSLVRLAARAFYDDISTKSENQAKNGRVDNRGLGVVVLDALTRRRWVREDDLAKDLKMQSKQLRRTLRFFEEEKLVTRDHRRETAKSAKIFSAAIAATGDGQHPRKEGEEKIKMHTHLYCCLDYSQIYDVLRYRLHRMKKKLKDELESRDTVQEYTCPSCQRRYTAFDALQLISLDDESFRCESCRTELLVVSDKFASEEIGDVDRRRRREKFKDLLQKMEIQLKPLMDQLARVKNLPVPEFGSLQAWERAHATANAENGNPHANDASKSFQEQGDGGISMSFLGETKVEVALPGVSVKDDDTKPGPETEAVKQIPPWMVTQGMNLTKEQRGEIEELKVGNCSTDAYISDDKESKLVQKEDINIQNLEAYYAALLKRQHEQEEAAKRKQEKAEDSDNGSEVCFETSSDRCVGMKSKRDEFERVGDEVKWEEAPIGGTTTKQYKLADLNMPACASEDDEDEIEWEEG